VRDEQDRQRTLAWFSEMGIGFENDKEQPDENRSIKAAGAILVCLLLLGYCVGLVWFPGLGS
jgi:hypothetical protein